MILIVAEHHDGSLRKSAYEAAHAALELAGALDTEVEGLVLGAEPSAPAAELAQILPKVMQVSDPALAAVRAQAWTHVIAEVAEKRGARVILMAATRLGLSASPRVAQRLDGSLLEDVTELWVAEGHVHAKRLSYLSRVTETVRATVEPVVVTTKLNMFPVAEGGVDGAVESVDVDVPAEANAVEVTGASDAAGGRVALDEADVVVTGGRGVGGEDGFTTLVEPLADALNAGVGSTRAAVDAGWRPYAEQIGQTGKTVAPSLYIALGVSGAVQHLSGMNRSKVIVAINKDADAPIFKVSDFGIVGDVHAVVPALIDAVKEGS